MGSSEMSGLFPKVEPCADCPESELAVFRRLKESLPAGWVAWHSLKVRTKGTRALRVVASRSEIEKDPILKKIAEP